MTFQLGSFGDWNKQSLKIKKIKNETKRLFGEKTISPVPPKPLPNPTICPVFSVYCRKDKVLNVKNENYQTKTHCTTAPIALGILASADFWRLQPEGLLEDSIL